MRLTRLYLRNYRVYEEPLELELPPGLTEDHLVARAAARQREQAIRRLFGLEDGR